VGKRRREVLGKIRALGARDWAELAEAQLMLARAQLVVFTRPRGGLIDGGAPEAAAVPAPLASSDVARRLGVAVSRAARFGVFRPRCLVRSLALQRMIERRGIEGSRIRIGVRREGERGERLSAHAWVEYGDLVLGDHDAHVGSFTRLADVRMKSS
jgi:hypothetical protein